MVPGFNIWCVRGIKGGWAMGRVSDGGRGEGHCVKVAIRGEDTPNDGHATMVGHSTGHAVKVSNIIPAAIKRID